MGLFLFLRSSFSDIGKVFFHSSHVSSSDLEKLRKDWPESGSFPES
jgi:hypothetical protein